MKFFIWVLFFLLLLVPAALSQTLKIECAPGSVCQVQHSTLDYRPPSPIGNVNMIVIYAVPLHPPDSLYYIYPDTTLPPWYNHITEMQSFLQTASRGLHNISVNILTNGTRPFRSSVDLGDGLTVYENINYAFVTSVLTAVDQQYNLGQYDNDGPDGIANSGDDDGYVDFVSFHVIWPNARGGIGLPFDYWVSSDASNRSGFGNIRISGQHNAAIRQIAYEDANNLGIPIHEYGHAMGNLPDMDHDAGGDWDHYSLGGFDVMAGGGFNGKASVYNPWFRDELLHWITPTAITGNSPSLQMTDLGNTGQVFKYTLSAPTNALPNEKFYVSYHTGTNSWESEWPVSKTSEPGGTGGVLIWHVTEGGAYDDRRRPPIDIEAAHGKFNWTEDDNGVYNTGVANSISGFDSLEIRKVKAVPDRGIKEVQGPYFDAVLNKPKNRGSASIFFVPNSDKEFSPSSNPNSNLYEIGDPYGQKVPSGIAVKNIVRSAGTTTLAFCTDQPSSTLPFPPTLVSPAVGAGNLPLSVTFTWKRNTGSTSHRLQVSTLPDFSGGFWTDVGGISDTSYAVTGFSLNTIYYWRVSAANSWGTSGWSNVWSFTTVAGPPSTPTLSLPTNASAGISTSPPLQWNASSGATSYRLQVSMMSSFTSGIVFDDSTITDTSRQVGPLANSTTYYWRVRAKNWNGTSGWSETWSFTTVALPLLSPPILLSPANNLTNVSCLPVLAWQAVTGATSYHLQVASDNTFTSILVDQAGIDSTTFQAGWVDASTVYYWRVRASNATGTSAWSDTWFFSTTLPEPSLISPASGAQNVSVLPVFTWHAVPGATSYDLEWSQYVGFNAYGSQTLDSTSFRPSSLQYYTTYWWRVRARSDNQESVSETRSFRTIAAYPSPPRPDVPANAQDFVQVPTTFVWYMTSVGVETSRLQIDTDSSFTDPVVFDSSGILPQVGYKQLTLSGLSYATTYYWRVNCTNVQGTSDWSATRSFRTSEARVTVQTNPAGLAFVVDSVTYTQATVLSWLPGTTHTISTTDVQNGSEGIRFVWQKWNDYGAIQHSIVPSGGARTYTATFSTQYRLSLSCDPPTYGSTTPTGDTWESPLANVEVIASPNSGYMFAQWSGDTTGPGNPIDVSMSAPKTITANFLVATPSGQIQQTRSGGAFVNADDDGMVGPGWASPGNVAASDNLRASATLKGTDDPNYSVTHFLKVTNFGFAIPAGVTINGILVEVEASKSGSGFLVTTAFITKNGSWLWGSHRDTAWPATESYVWLGGAADKWGTTWTPSAINATDFGIGVYAGSLDENTATAKIDHIRITVYYTLPPLPAAPLLNSPPDFSVNVSPSPTLTWNASSGALTYHLHVSTTSDFTTTVYDQSEISTTSRTLEGLAGLTVHYWRVNATNVSGTGEWSFVRSFTTEGSQVRSGGTIVDDASTGSVVWSNPSNAQASDNARATASLPESNSSHYLKASNFGFSIPSNATVNGIVVEVERSRSSTSSSIVTTSAKLVKNGVIGGSDKGSYGGTEWPTADAYGAYGDSVDTWGLALTPADVNAAGFGFALSASNFGATGYARVDHIRIKVYYSFPLPPPTLVLPADGSTEVTTLPALSWNLTWNAVLGASSYRLQLSTDSSFSSVMFDQSGILGTSRVINGLSDQTTYHWRVNATNAIETSNWSTVRSFTAALPPPAAVVISQIYGGGGQSSSYGDAPYTNDFVELFNRTEAPVSLDGWSIQSATTAGSTWSVVPLSDSIGAGKYYLIKLASGGSNGTAELPPPDATGTVSLSSSAGKVALVNSTLPLSGSFPSGNSSIIDFVGYGSTANSYEGNGPTANPDVYKSVIRLSGGNTDTNNNTQDFIVAHPTPRNSGQRMTRSGGTFAIDPTVGTVNWNSPTHVQASDNAYASASLSLSQSKYLKVTNFGFDVPSEATITGILVEVERRRSGLADIRTYSVKMTKGGSITGTDKAYFGETWPLGVDIYRTCGGATDLWGLGWTPGEINASDFGVAVSAQENQGGSGTASIDHIQITVYYSFFLQPPVLASPASEATGVSIAPTLSWNASNGASSYRLQVSTSSTFEITIFDQSAITNTSQTLTALSHSTTYHWRVNASNAAGTSDWSSARSFTTQALGKFAESDTLKRSAPSVIEPTPTQFEIGQNYPNPFNPETEIAYGVPKESHVRLAVYDLLGREVRILIDGIITPGFHRVRWDGRDKLGSFVPSGVYICRFDSPKGSIVKKMLLLK
jgi:hypothetical protein